jgi:cytochrome c oxidase subunit I
VAQMTAPAAGSDGRMYTTCDVTELRMEESGRRLALANGVAGVVLLAIAGTMALLVATQRLEVVTFISDDVWYRLVAAHGTTALLYWLLFFEVAGLYWGSTALLGAPMRVPRLAWGVFGLMVAGVAISEFAMLTDDVPVMFTAYPPLEASWYYYLGVLMVAVGVLIAVGIFFANVVGARRDGYHTGTLPLVTFGFATAAIIAVFALGTGAVAYGAVFLASLGVVESVDPAFYRLFFWGIGHGAQQVNLAAMVAIWYALAGLTVGARPVNEGLSRIAFVLLLAFIHLGAVHHLMVDPGLGTSHRLMNTSYLLYLAVLASLIHAFSIPAAIELGQRERGHDRNLFGWLKAGPWRSPGFSSLVLSLILFGFFGGVTGVIMGQMQMNMLVHNTLFVPGHFHGTVVAGTTLAFMGIAYYLVPQLSGRTLANVGMARVQPWLFAGGVTILMLGMSRLGQMGVPRRVADLEYTDAVVPTEVFSAAPTQTMMLITIIGAVLAVVGGAMFVWIMVMTLLNRGEPRPGFGFEVVFAGTHPGTELHVLRERGGQTAWWSRYEAPGTLVIVLGFFVFFVAMYGLAHINLSRVWPVS